MKRNYFLFILLAFIISLSSCNSLKINTSPTPSLSLSFQEYGGANSGAVTYNPEKKLYYIVMAGNETFPLEIFDEKGKPLLQLEAGLDSRGMWWNPNTNTLERNGYASFGWVSNTPSTDGYIVEEPVEKIFFGQNQPDENSCGVFDQDANEVAFYNAGSVFRYSRETGKEVGKVILLGIEDDRDIVEHCMIYTGIEEKEYGVLNYVTKEVYLFDKISGVQTETIKLPQSTNVDGRFGLAYANKYVWVYYPETRTWTGFKILK